MGEFDDAFNAEVFQQVHMKILAERDGQWVVREEVDDEGEDEKLDVWISQSCYLEDQPTCLVTGC